MYVCIQNVCSYTWRHDALLWQPYMMQTTVELNCSRSIKSSNKLNRSAEPIQTSCFCRASAVLVSNRSTTYELCLNLHILFSSLIGYFVTSDCTAFATAFMIGLSKRVCVKRSSRLLVTHFIFCTSCIFWAGCWLFYWLLADRGAVSSRETIGFVWLMLVVLLIARWSWSSFMQGNDWFCLIDISNSAPAYSLLIARTLCWFRQR